MQWGEWADSPPHGLCVGTCSGPFAGHHGPGVPKWSCHAPALLLAARRCPCSASLVARLARGVGGTWLQRLRRCGPHAVARAARLLECSWCILALFHVCFQCARCSQCSRSGLRTPRNVAVDLLEWRAGAGRLVSSMQGYGCVPTKGNVPWETEGLISDPMLTCYLCSVMFWTVVVYRSLLHHLNYFNFCIFLHAAMSFGDRWLLRPLRRPRQTNHVLHVLGDLCICDRRQIITIEALLKKRVLEKFSAHTHNAVAVPPQWSTATRNGNTALVLPGELLRYSIV